MAATPYTHAQTALITGAGSGLGRAFALAWAAKGWKVGVLDLDLAAAEETLELVEWAGGSGEVYRCDVSSLAEVEAAAEHFWGSWGRVDLLVNNAGIGGGGSLGEVPMDHWEKVLGIDLWGVIYNCHAHIPRMKAAGGGHIVNVSSAAGLYSVPRFSPYNAPKAAVVAISQTLYSELAPWRIGVTVVCPPVVKTNIIDNSLGMMDGVAYDIGYELELLRMAMLNSRITPEELARRTVRAVQRNRLYVVIGAGNFLSWLNVRLAPSLFYRNMAFLTRHGWEKPLFAYFARKGLM